MLHQELPLRGRLSEKLRYNATNAQNLDTSLNESLSFKRDDFYNSE